MAQRSLHSHGAFFGALLSTGDSVLDCGCGPGSITIGIAERVSPGQVTGVDFGSSQIKHAMAAADAAGVCNVTFQAADCYSLPFADESFDRVFSHALLEHLAEPVRALREFHRVLKPDGIVGVCSPDWDGFIVAPPSAQVSRALAAYAKLQERNGGDLRVGRKLGDYLTSAGFVKVQMAARYECYPSLHLIGEYLALQLEREGDIGSARTFRDWCHCEGGLFAQTWVSATACKTKQTSRHSQPV